GRAESCRSVMESAVAYDGLPISSGGAHGLGRASARDALAAWLRFLDACTVASPIESYFDFPATPGLMVEGEVARLIEHEFPRSSGRFERFPVPPEGVEAALVLLESIEPQPTNQWGMAPVWLWFEADFRLRSPRGPGLWPGQDPDLFGHFHTPSRVILGASSTRLILQAKRSLGLSLSIPVATDADLAVIVPWLQASLPMAVLEALDALDPLTDDKRSYRGMKIRPGRAPG
ncbi:MAG TPA: hypothetical protein VE990_06285, partial [Acidimicrobiales bacterium]|nr:hypothetical protein [Acidimicrobiales bacterium]